MLDHTDHTLAQAHRRVFAVPPTIIASAPGRVNLIGEHIDYSGGVVLPYAIDRRARIALSPDAPANTVTIYAADLDESASFTLPGYLESPPPPGTWAHYVMGPLALLLADHAPDHISWRGLNLSVTCAVPPGAGLSSSAAIEVAAARALNQHLSLGLAPLELARLCQRAEHRFTSVPCGLMDQAASAMAPMGKLLAFDCQSQTGRVIEPIQGHTLIVIDSTVRHSLGDSAYRQRRQAAESAASKLDAPLRAIADAQADPDLFSLTEPEREAAAHAISEMRRVHAAIDAIQRHDPARLGELMNASHASMRDVLRISCDEVDALAHAAQQTPGVLGARMTGGGFGGCVIALAPREHAPRILDMILSRCPPNLSPKALLGQ